MIPSIDSELLEEEELNEIEAPSQQYKLHITADTVRGYCDELEAMQQVIYKILNTERYDYLIYSWDYGIELKDLIGKDMLFVIPEIEERITDALTADERITSVDGFEFEQSGRKLTASFTVHTIFGDVGGEREVII